QARSGGRRRSCNRCSAKKERCDGHEPCHRCIRAGSECLYASCRTLGRPRNQPAPPKGGCSGDAGGGRAKPTPAASRKTTSTAAAAGSATGASTVTTLKAKPSGAKEGTSGGGGGEASAAPPAWSGMTEIPGGGRGRGGCPTPCPPGLEAARERRRLRRAEPMSMVSDIMAMLSQVSWTARVEEAAQKTKRELSELRALMTAEKALVEERRRANWLDTRPFDGIAVCALASASIGLHCALHDFSELLRFGREVASCTYRCPGLARYQPHAYHAALVILAAFGKRSEFELLLTVAPGELRLSESTGRPLTYDEHADTCSHAVCRRHAKVIVEMSKGLAREEATARTAAAEAGEEEEKEGGEGGRRRSLSSGEVGSTAAVTADSGESGGDNHPTTTTTTTTPGERKSAATTAGVAPPMLRAPQGERSSALVSRSPPPSPAEDHPSSARDFRMPDAGPASAAPVAAVMPAGQPGLAEQQQHPFAAVLPGSAVAEPREAEGAAAVETGERRWAQDYPPCWPAVPPTSGGELSPNGAGGAAMMTGTRSPSAPVSQADDGVAPLRRGGAGDQNLPPSSSSPLQAPSFGHRQGMRLGVLSAAATAITAPAARGAAEVRRGGDRSAGGASASASSRLPVGSRPSQEQRGATTSTYSLAASGDDLGLAGLAAARHGHGHPAALQASLRNSSSSRTPRQAPVFYGPRRAQQQFGMPTPVAASPQQEASARAMAMKQQQVSPVRVAVSGGVRAMQAAAPTAGTLTSRLWGMPRQQQQQKQPGAQANSSPPGPASAGQFVPSLAVSTLGVPRPCGSQGLALPPWQWQVGGGGDGGGTPSAGEPRPPPATPPPAASSDLQLMSNEMLLEDDDTPDMSQPCARQESPAAAAAAAAVAGLAVGLEAPPSPPLPLPREGRATATTGGPSGMTAGEASAAAIALATLSGAPATLSKTPSATAAAAAAVGRGATAAEGGWCVGEVNGRERRSYEEEMIALWELIATGDSE
ncbi:unnamed protein product, partial [Ectocarpus sp. 13 AM-2016]